MKMSTITIRVDKNIKEQAEQIFENIGLNTTTAFTLFMKSVIREGEIPFKLKVDPFFCESNMNSLKLSIKQLEDGQSVTKTLEELKELENEI